MIVRSVHPLSIYHKLREKGYYYGDEKHVWPEFKEPYQWMIGQMEERLPNYDGSTYPVWVWKRTVNRNEKALLPRGTKGVILTLEIPEEDILWSDFLSWHLILNKGPITENEEEYNQLEADEDQQAREATWPRVFDFDFLRKADKNWSGTFDEEWIQGVTPLIRMDQVKKVTRFIAK